MITFESAINRLAERVSDRTQESRNIRLQRRNQVVDIYGMEFTRQGDIGEPASFYISISPDLIYFERFEFKVIIESFRVPIAGANGDSDSGISLETVRVRDRSLNLNVESTSLNSDTAELGLTTADISVSETVASPNPHSHQLSPNPHNHQITPNPHRHTIPSHNHTITPNSHNHETDPHNHTIRAGMSFETVTASQFTIWIWIEDKGQIGLIPGLIEPIVSSSGDDMLRINMTPYFMALLPAEPRFRWINGEGVFPSAGLINFDVLEAVAYMDEKLREGILKPGYKRIDIEGDGIFNATLVNYLKYSHVNR